MTTTNNAVQLLYKKFFSTAQTDQALDVTSESTPSSNIFSAKNIWLQSDQIPTNAAAAQSGIVQTYLTTNRIQLYPDSSTQNYAVGSGTTQGSTGGGFFPAWRTDLTDWIDPNIFPTSNSPSYAIIGYITTSNSFGLVGRGATITSGSSVVTLSTALSASPTTGWTVAGPGIPAGTTVAAGSTTTSINLSQNATASKSGTVITLANISTPGTNSSQIFPAGSGSGQGEFIFDYNSGVLSFINNTFPTSPVMTTNSVVFITGYRYIGTKGIYPSQTSNSGKYLTTDGTNVSWGTVTLNNGTITGSLTAGGGTGTNGQVLQSTGSGVQWATVSGGGGGGGGGTTTNPLTIGTGLSGTSFDGSAAVTIAIDSTVATLTGSQTLTNKTINASNNTISNISLTSSVTGALPATNGGTGQTSYTTGDILYASSSSALSKLSAGVNGYVLTLDSGVPTWQQSPGTNASNEPILASLLYR